MQDKQKIRLYKHDILSITAGLEAAMDILIEEVENNENDMAKLYKSKIDKLNLTFEKLLAEANINL